MLVFDLEANGFLDTVTCIHCLVIKDTSTGKVFQFRPSEVEQGVKLLMRGDVIVGHNVINYDLPVIQKIYPWFSYDESKVVDTLVLSRLIWTNLSDLDSKNGRVEPANNGKHKLEAWGQRLGLLKQEYTGGFEAFSEEMLEYNAVDVEVTERLWNHIEKQAVDPRASELEHQVAFIIARQERRGVRFDIPAAERLTTSFQTERLSLEEQLQDTFKPFYMSAGEKIAKRTTNGKKAPGTWEGAPYTKIKLTLFNPGSRHHIAHRLKAMRGWSPSEFTENGQPKVDETVLSKLPYPEASLLGRYFLIQKRLGMLCEGDNAWLKLVQPDGRLHGEVITNGAVTGRATHIRPNLAQVPKVGSPHGAECRALFLAAADLRLCGVDLSGLELRMLAHYLALFDGGAYGKLVCEGDVHTANMLAAGLADRNTAKTFIYAFLKF